ncbi:MAG: hypothetical protein IJ789_06105 [Bacteroidales bacterium]|nr:hypothetical protein [Bacteroidales bacterium]
MKNIHIFSTLCIAAMFMLTANTAQAQLRQSIFLNGNLPMGSWATSLASNTPVPLTPKNMGKDASIGFGAGYRAQYLFDVGAGEVAPFANIDLLWNTVSKNTSDNYTQYNYKKTSYFNVPIFVGVSYLNDQIVSDITFFGEAGIGADALFMTNEGDKNNSSNYYSYKPSFNIAGEVGIGAYFGRHVSAGIHYYIMGQHTVDMTAKSAKNHPATQAYYTTPGNRQTRTVGSLMLRIGFHL